MGLSIAQFLLYDLEDMKNYHYAIVCICTIVLSPVIGSILFLITGLGPIANFGSIILSGFIGGLIAGALSKTSLVKEQAAGLGLVYVIVGKIALSYAQGIRFNALAIIIMLILYTAIFGFFLMLGSRVSAKEKDVPAVTE